MMRPHPRLDWTRVERDWARNSLRAQFLVLRVLRLLSHTRGDSVGANGFAVDLDTHRYQSASIWSRSGSLRRTHSDIRIDPVDFDRRAKTEPWIWHSRGAHGAGGSDVPTCRPRNLRFTAARRRRATSVVQITDLFTRSRCGAKPDWYVIGSPGERVATTL
jgi:hypothetical protein